MQQPYRPSPPERHDCPAEDAGHECLCFDTPYRTNARPFEPVPLKKLWLCIVGLHVWCPRFRLEPQLHGDDSLEHDIICAYCEVRYRRHIRRFLQRLRVWWATPLRRPRSPCCNAPFDKATRSRRYYNSGRCPKCRLSWAAS